MIHNIVFTSQMVLLPSCFCSYVFRLRGLMDHESDFGLHICSVY